MKPTALTGIAERREDLRGNADVRATRTRQRLVDAFERAVSSGATPSVASLCKDAKVGRTTFYTHFATVEDLAVTLAADAFASIADADAAARAGREQPGEQIANESLQRVVRDLGSLRDVLLTGIRLGTRAGVLEHLVNVVAVHTHAVVAASIDDTDQRRISARFLAAGVVHAVVDWIESEEPVDEPQLVEALTALLPPFLTAPVRKLPPPPSVRTAGRAPRAGPSQPGRSRAGGRD